MSNPLREGDPPQSSFLAGVRVLEITGALAARTARRSSPTSAPR
ncbi:hypothetical protein [Actinomadura madurae]|nr:hypothetical protein [Actinomadura madurae]